MIRGLVESMLGKAGTSVLTYYEGHALIIGLVIIAYGVLMYLSWRNLVQIYRFLVQAAAATLEPEGEKPAPAKAKAKRSRRETVPAGHPARGQAELPWQAAVDSVRFPFVSPRAGLWPMKKSVAAVQKIIDERELWEHAYAVAAGADVRRVAPAYRLAARGQMEPRGKN